MILSAITGLVLHVSALVAQPHHDPIYLIGGDLPVASPGFVTGVNVLDARGGGLPVVTPLLAPGAYSRFVMDANNRDIVVGVEARPNATGPTSGLYRLDPATKTLYTIAFRPAAASIYHSYGHVTIDHNGDYVYEVARITPYAYQSFIMKCDQAGQMTTLLSTVSLPGLRGPVFLSRLTRDIDTGHVLVCATEAGLTVPTTVNSPILAIDTETGSFTTWAVTTGYAGWKGFRSLTQNHRTGLIEAAFENWALRQYPGTGGRKLVAILPTPHFINGAGAYDLQTAPRPRLVYLRDWPAPSGPQTYLSHLDPATWAVTSTAASTRETHCYGFDFYRGRHTQSLSVGARRWVIRLSAPRFAGYPYVVAAGVSGVRPGVGLADGSRINLVPDGVTGLTMGNLIPAIWNPGPGILDASGVARARLDLTAIGKLGRPLWIAWAVLDPKSPTGFAYLPDTYVMRI